jgi:hypothetical protein
VPRVVATREKPQYLKFSAASPKVKLQVGSVVR